MPNRGMEWEDIQVRYKEAMKNFIASMENPAPTIDEDNENATNNKEIPIITISDDDPAVVVSTDNVVEDVQISTDDTLMKEADVAVVEDDGTEVADVAANDDVVINPDSKALTVN
jgi:hypothetical protein